MKIIDEKGRIFGKINVIDFLVILFLVFLAPVFFFAYKIVFMAEPLEREFIEIERNCLLIKLKPEVLELISNGDKELNRNGQVIGEIVSLSRSVPYKYEFNIGKDQKIIKEDPILKQINAKLRLTVEVKQNTLYYKDREISIGLPLNFRTEKYSLMTVPLEEEKGEEKMINLYVTLIDLDQELLKDISVGNKETDENDNTIAEILSLDRVEDSSLKFDLGIGSVVKEEEGAKKQISARMRLKCQVEDGSQLYFKGEKVEYNSLIEFKTDKYEISGLVTLKEKWLKLRVKLTRVVPEVARFIQKGDIEKDVFDRTIGSIDSILSNEPALMMEAMTDEGEFITLHHPLERDIVVSLDAQCMEKEGAYYYKDSLAKMGNEIVFSTTSYSILGMIVGLRIE